MPAIMNKFHWVLCTSAALVFVAGCRKDQTNKPAPVPLVVVTTVSQTNVPVYHEWIGSLDGLVNAEIRAQVTGYLISQDYREGDIIKKGDRLFEIDPRPFRAVRDQAKGRLSEAQARLGKTELDVKRYAPLVKDRAISQEEYDDAVQANLEAQATIVAAQAQVEQAELNLEFTKITSPIDGIASIAKAQIGNLVGPATGELTTVSTVDPIKVYFNVTEQAYINFAKNFEGESGRLARLRQLPIELILADGSIYPKEGQIYAVDRSIGATTGALRVEALFPNPTHSLRPGEFARVRLKFDVLQDALLVPQRAVSELQGAHQVALVDAENKAHIVPVQVGERTGQMWVISEGLHAGDRVIVEGLQKVREGTAVTTSNYVQTAGTKLD